MLILLICFFSPLSLHAQNQEKITSAPLILINLDEQIPGEGTVVVNQLPQITALLNKYIANNHLTDGIPGYRIHIFSQSGQIARQKANETRSEFMKNFPGMEAYLQYNAPNFQIYVGDFRTKSEALGECKKISRKFPNAFIVNETINLQ